MTRDVTHNEVSWAASTAAYLLDSAPFFRTAKVGFKPGTIEPVLNSSPTGTGRRRGGALTRAPDRFGHTQGGRVAHPHTALPWTTRKTLSPNAFRAVQPCSTGRDQHLHRLPVSRAAPNR